VYIVRRLYRLKVAMSLLGADVSMGFHIAF
jgi:hypothetical protein